MSAPTHDEIDEANRPLRTILARDAEGFEVWVGPGVLRDPILAIDNGEMFHGMDVTPAGARKIAAGLNAWADKRERTELAQQIAANLTAAGIPTVVRPAPGEGDPR